MRSGRDCTLHYAYMLAEVCSAMRANARSGGNPVVAVAVVADAVGSQLRDDVVGESALRKDAVVTAADFADDFAPSDEALVDDA